MSAFESPGVVETVYTPSGFDVSEVGGQVILVCHINPTTRALVCFDRVTGGKIAAEIAEKSSGIEVVGANTPAELWRPGMGPKPR